MQRYTTPEIKSLTILQLCTKMQEKWDLLLSKKKDIKKWIMIRMVF